MAYISELWNMQWLNGIGAMLAILSALYTGCSYLGKKLDARLDTKPDKKLDTIKTVTDSLAMGMVVAFLFIFFSLISVVFDNIGVSLLQDLYHAKIVLPILDTSIGFSIAIPGGLIIGVALGVLYHILKEKGDYFNKNSFLFGLAGFMLMLCCSIGIVEWPLFAGLFSSNEFLFSLLLYSAGDIGGCLFGLAIMQTRKSVGRNLIVFFLFIILTLLFVLFSSHGDHIYEDVLYGIFHYSQLGLLIGINVNQWSQPRKDVEKVSWSDFIFWLFLGGIAIPVMLLAIFTVNSNNSSFIDFILHYFLILGIINSRGDQIIKYIKFRGRLKEGHIHLSINWKRFVYGLIIGILYVIPVVLFKLLTDVLLRRTIGVVIYNLLQNLDFSILVGLIIGFIYGFGPFLIDRIDDLDEQRLVQMGIGLTALGAFIIIIPH